MFADSCLGRVILFDVLHRLWQVCSYQVSRISIGFLAHSNGAEPGFAWGSVRVSSPSHQELPHVMLYDKSCIRGVRWPLPSFPELFWCFMLAGIFLQLHAHGVWGESQIAMACTQQSAEASGYTGAWPVQFQILSLLSTVCLNILWAHVKSIVEIVMHMNS